MVAFLFRWLLRLASGLVLLTVGAFLLAYYFASRSLPDYDGSYSVAGVSEPVEIVRDNANVPHIFAANDLDAFYALGFAQAQDRFWQLIVLRRTAQGRLSELFGQRTLATDRLMRRLDLYGSAVLSASQQDPQTSKILEAYADGVNAWINEVNAGARGRGAPEMWLFNHAVSPWSAADSIAILKLVALQMSGHAQAEVLRARTSLNLSPERLADILPDDPLDPLIQLPEYAELVPDVAPSFAALQTPSHPLHPVKTIPLAGASNAWASGRTRSANGSTLLANDPHLSLSAPTLWYLARLELQRGGVIGAMIPGVPAILSGRSADLGWGITASFMDDQDLFIEELNTEDPTQYRVTEGWAPFETRDSIINVKGAVAETLKLRWTVNGPVLAPDQLNVGSVTPPGHVASLSWTALSDTDQSIGALLALLDASTLEQGMEAVANVQTPSLNFTLVDRNTTSFIVAGRAPNRSENHQSFGRLPTFGYLPENRWDGLQGRAARAEVSDGNDGLVGNTNNKTTDAPFPDHVSFLWGDTQRIKRWEALMQRRQVHTRDSFVEAQLDTVSYAAQSLLPLVGADLWFTGEAATDGTLERRRRQALDLLSAWNGDMNEHLPEPLIFAAWMRFLQQRLITDELGDLALEFTHMEPVFIERVYRDVDGASAWCDIAQSAPVETCSDIARLALDDALIWLAETYGTSVTSLRWGDAHEAAHDHAVLFDAPILNWFVNIRQSTSGGDQTLQMGRTSGVGQNPFQNVHAAGYRGVYDFADPDSSIFITSTGQSGHLLSRYYDNLGELWRRGEYVPMSLDPALARGAALGITSLLPLQ